MGCSFTSSPSPQNLGSMEGTRTLNRDNSVLQPQAKGSESDTATPELLNPQVRSPPPPDHMRGGGGPSFHGFLFYASHSLLLPSSPSASHHPHPHPTARESQVRVSSTCFVNPLPQGSPCLRQRTSQLEPSDQPSAWQPPRPLPQVLDDPHVSIPF